MPFIFLVKSTHNCDLPEKWISDHLLYTASALFTETSIKTSFSKLNIIKNK